MYQKTRLRVCFLNIRSIEIKKNTIIKSNVWSAQDRADQTASRLFSVMGKVDSATPELLLTAGSNQQEKKLKIEEVFDMECQKLHEHSDYTISEALVSNITERKFAATTYPAHSTWNKNRVTTTPATTKPATTGTGYPYYASSKTTLINKIYAYDTSYTLSSLKLQDLVTSFLDFLDESVYSKDTNYSTDLDNMQDIFDNLLSQVDLTFDCILDHFKLKNPEEDQTKTVEAESQDAPQDSDFVQSPTPNHFN